MHSITEMGFFWHFIVYIDDFGDQQILFYNTMKAFFYSVIILKNDPAVEQVKLFHRTTYRTTVYASYN